MTVPSTSRAAPDGPPGIRFWAATLLVVVLALDANSRGSFPSLLVIGPLIGITVVWLIRAARAPWQVTTIRDRARWLAIPAFLVLVFGLTRSDLLKDARFNLSRGALDDMAADVMAGGPLGRGWVGLYSVDNVERTANGFRFVLADNGLSRIGLAYAPSGEPLESEANFDPLWQPAEFEHLDGPWWWFAQGWD